jgi:hypothetical protein
VVTPSTNIPSELVVKSLSTGTRACRARYVGPGAGLPERLLTPESPQKPPRGAHALAIPCSVVPTRRTGIGVARGVLNVPEARAGIKAECLAYSPTALAVFSRNSEPSRK